MISIVVVGLNEERLIERCFKSIVAQRFQLPFEVIYVDGGSIDRTVKLVENYTSLLRLTIIIRKGKRIGNSREEGFSIAKAPIIASADSDVVLPIDWLEQIYAHFAAHPECLGVVGPYTVYPSGKLYRFVFVTSVKFWDFVGRVISGFQAFRGMNFVVRRDAWKKSGGFERTISALEDVDLALKVSKLGPIHYLPKLVVRTTPRRFKKDIIKSTAYRLMAYYHRVFLRDYQYADWEQVRESK